MVVLVTFSGAGVEIPPPAPPMTPWFAYLYVPNVIPSLISGTLMG